MHSQAASQGTGVVNDRNADMAMYWLSASTFTNIRSDDACGPFSTAPIP
jgi:hypothetical protein